MKIRKVTIKNLNSIRLHTYIDFEAPPLGNTGLFAITGDTGAGKTTILDAVTLALYGRIHRNKEVREVMSYGAAESQAEVEFDAGGERYLARWLLWRAHNKVDGNIQPARREVARWDADSEQYVLIAEKVREADEVIEEVTGLDYDRFTRSVLLAQGDFAAFLQAGEKDRSDLLERITGTEVYTQLSQAAYERHKLEGRQLEDLQRRRASLAILSEEKVAELEAELTAAKKRETELRRELTERREDLAWRQRKAALEGRIRELNAESKVLEDEAAAAEGELKRLAAYQRIRTFEPQLNRLDDLLAAVAEAESERAALTAQLETETERCARVRTRFERGQRLLEAARAELAGKRALFEAVIELDTTLKERRERLAAIEKRTKTQEEQRQALRATRKSGRSRQEELEKRSAALTEWLAARAHLTPLQDELSVLEAQARRWKDKSAEAERISAEEAAVAAELKAVQAAAARLQLSENALRAELETLADAFRAQAPDGFVTGRSELLEKMSTGLENLTNRRERLRELVTLAAEYKDLLRRQDQHEAEIESLVGRELLLHKGLMTAVETLEAQDKALAYRTELFHQQQLIANYEKDRRQLKAGEPCPLCFSTEHPFRREEVRPFVDEAKRDLDRAAQAREKAYDNYKELMKQHNELNARLEQLTGSDRAALKGRREELQERLEQCEGRIVALGLSEKLMRIGELHALKEVLQASERELAGARRAREALQRLHLTLEKKEKQHVDCKEQLAAQQTKVEVLKQKREHIARQAADRQGEADQLMASMREALDRYGYDPAEKDAVQLLADLRSELKQFQEKREGQREIEEERKLLAQQLENLERQEAQTAKQLRAAQEEGEEAAEALETLQQKRRDRFGEDDPRTVRRALETRIAECEEKLEKEREALAAAQRARERIESRIRQREGDAEKGRRRAEALESQLVEALQAEGLESLATARDALLEQEELQRLETMRRSLEQRRLETGKALRDVEAELKQVAMAARTELEIPDLQQQIATLEGRQSELLQTAGALQQQLRSNTEKQQEAESLIAAIEDQRREFDRWAKLNDIIGAADGKKFRVFAQGLTLARLVRLANEHLQHLNGRYLIRKRSDEDLELDILDTFQADHRRSMNTLSGGERFLVSLALALGLSDLAGQRTNIRSLFIDEGFGTLDENSLDLAISTLENLQASGKTIGIISHVKELKERIAVQIQLRKRGNGFSEVEIVG